MDTLDPPSHAAPDRTHAANKSKGGGNWRESRDPLSDLSEASAEYGKARGAARPPRRLSGMLLAAFAALLVGGVVASVGRIDYRCAADLKLTPTPSPSRRAHYRKELLNYTWQALSPKAPDDAPPEWFVASPSTSELRLCVQTPDRERGVDRVRALATGFVETVKALEAERRATPTETERLLASYGQQLEQGLEKLQAKLDDALATLPGDDPHRQRHRLRAQWNELRKSFSFARRRVAESSEDYKRLLAEPEPTHGVVTTEARRARLEADDALQQDLSELTVVLTEVKTHTLAVWQRADPPLAALVDGTAALADALPQAESDASPATMARVAPIADGLADYRQRLTAFRDGWTTAFTELREQSVDPYTAGVLDRYGDVRRLLGDFLFGSSRSLSRMRRAVHALSESRSDLARDYVLSAKLVRAFHRIQNAHHKFEFVAQDVQSTDHFRLDAALQSARGLQRRTRARIDAIERALQGEALTAARKQRLAERRAAKELMERVRTTADETVDNLVDLQQKLNLSADLSEEFQRAMLEVEVAASRLQSTQSYLDKTNNRLRDLRTRRLTPENPTAVTLHQCHVVGSVIDWGERTRTGVVGAALTLVTVLLGQWWAGRR